MKKSKSVGIEHEIDFGITKKGEQKIQINAHLTAVCLLGAGYLFSTIHSDSPIVTIIICQILCPIPLLITSSMAYLKLIISTTQNRTLYDILAWFTHSLAYGMILNSLTLIAVYKGFILTAQIFFVSYNVLYIIYSLVNIYVQNELCNME